MQKLVIIICLVVPCLGQAQAHIGSSLNEIKDFHPDKEFTVDYTSTGVKYAFTDMYLGTFVYYLDNEGVSTHCMQIPDNMQALNTQVEIYNRKYVIVSETSWKAYLEAGNIMKIDLVYDEELEDYMFFYTDQLDQ